MSKIHVKNDLAAFLHGELNEDAAFQVVTHLSQCAECRAEFEEIKLGDDLAKRLSLDIPSNNVWAHIEEELVQETPRRRVARRGRLGWLRVSFAMVAMLAIVAGLWWYQTRVPAYPVRMNFDKYLSMLESHPRERFPDPFAEMPEEFGKVDSVTAHQSLGLKEVGREMTALGYKLYANRLRPTKAGDLAQFIYGNDKEVIAVFVMPKSVKCDFGPRNVEPAQIGEFPCARIVSQTVSTLWRGNEQHQLVFVIFNVNEASLVSVLRIFTE